LALLMDGVEISAFIISSKLGGFCMAY